jgi:hypothetical protein
MPIQLLNEDSYRGSNKGAVISDGQSGHTHIALIAVAAEQPAVRCYVKFYPDSLGGREHRGLVNEMTGHVLGSLLGAAVPELAGLIVVKGSQLADLPAWATESSVLVGWWTQELASPSLRAHYDLSNLSQPSLAIDQKFAAALEELRKSSQIHEIIALDELIANVDRNIGNLLRIKAGGYVLIDQGKCLTRDEWLATDLDPSQSYENKLITILQPHSQLLPFKHATVKAHEALTHNIEAAIQKLVEWLQIAVGSDETDAIEHFIRVRAGRSHLTQRMSLFI